MLCVKLIFFNIRVMCATTYALLLMSLINVFELQNAVKQTEAKLRDYGWNVLCKLQPNGYDCTKKRQPMVPKFYYDLKMEDCKTFTYGNCPNTKNAFNTLHECHDRCRDDGIHDVKDNLTASIYCLLQPDFGTCNSYYPMWYYDVTQQVCRGFSYSGCGGNSNRFSNAQLCSAVCGVGS